jgi:acetyl esterase/lipase
MKALLLLCLLTSAAFADTQTDIEYARAGDLSLKLDLHRPQGENPPLIVYVHGGAWRAGTKSDVPIYDLLGQGFAIASVDYRLSTQAQFPAQAHDIKAAIRYLRANAARLHINADKIAIAGSSAGGHLAALVGVTNGNQDLEGKLGDHLDQSSDIACIISLYGASNLQTILGQSTEDGLEVRVPALKLLLGGLPNQQPDLARLASPVNHLDKKDPPLLLIHGDADPQMPPQQSEEFAKAYKAAGLTVTHLVLPGSLHGGSEFYDEDRTQIMADFLKKHLTN